MAFTILQNQRNGKIVLHATANQTSNLTALAVAGETINGLQINQVIWGCGNSGSHWTISRGANVYLVLAESGHQDLAGNGVAIQADQTANVTVTLNLGTVGSVILECQKMGPSLGTYSG